MTVTLLYFSPPYEEVSILTGGYGPSEEGEGEMSNISHKRVVTPKNQTPLKATASPREMSHFDLYRFSRGVCEHEAATAWWPSKMAAVTSSQLESSTETRFHSRKRVFGLVQYRSSMAFSVASRFLNGVR